MNQVQKARRFAELHVKGSPVVLYNAWDSGSAKAVLEAGAGAIATSSWAVAAAHGYKDGEAIPQGFAEQVIGRIAGAIEAPVSADFEGGYSEDDAVLAENVTRLLTLGIVGINFEDRFVHGSGLYPIERQASRIAAVRAAADKFGVDLFINARSDIFFGGSGDPSALVGEALDRAQAYQSAGASGFFVPGLRDEALIGRLAEMAGLKVNVMMMAGVPPAARLAELGVARISYGPIPYLAAMDALKAAAARVIA